MAVIVVHALFVFAGIPTLQNWQLRSPGMQALAYYACTQMLFAILAWYFAFHSLRGENPIELKASTWLVFSVLVFDVSVLVTNFNVAGDVLQTTELLGEGEGEGYVKTVLFSVATRLSFVCLLLFTWLPMTYFASK